MYVKNPWMLLQGSRIIFLCNSCSLPPSTREKLKRQIHQSFLKLELQDNFIDRMIPLFPAELKWVDEYVRVITCQTM